MNAEPAIAARDVVKTFPGMDRPALNSFSGRFESGSITGLAGPDGAGKSTLLRLLVGLLKADSGHIRVAGFDAAKEAASIHTIAGYMPQKFGLYEDLSVMENLRLYADLRGVSGADRQEHFGRLLGFTGLEPFTGRLAGKLSGGMKQKLGLACALLGKPRVLLLDEPSVGVDPISRRELWSMVERLIDGGMAVVWSTSYLDEAERCQAVILLNEGEVLYEGAPGDMISRVNGRTWKLNGVAPEKRRSLLMKLMGRPWVTDAVIQGRALRIVGRQSAPEGAAAPKGSDEDVDGVFSAGKNRGRESGVSESPDREKAEGAIMAGEIRGAAWIRTEPRFEDAFIDLLGGGPDGISLLGESMAEKPDSGRPVIEAKGLSKRFGDFIAVRDNSFTIRRGEIFGLLGPNGAGKSTTFKMLCGLLKPSSGTASIMGIDLAASSSLARARIGYMAQKFSLYGALSVRQNLRFFSGVYGLSGKERDAVMEMMISLFKLERHLNANAETLPLGYKQRLALACSVMHQPDVLFLDEPTSGVDPVTRREFWMHINAMVRKGVTVMVTTHFMDEAEYCDRIALIYRGENIAMGTPDELKAGVTGPDLPDPTLEDAFIALVEQSDAEARTADRERRTA